MYALQVIPSAGRPKSNAPSLPRRACLRYDLSSRPCPLPSLSHPSASNLLTFNCVRCRVQVGTRAVQIVVLPRKTVPCTRLSQAWHMLDIQLSIALYLTPWPRNATSPSRQSDVRRRVTGQSPSARHSHQLHLSNLTRPRKHFVPVTIAAENASQRSELRRQ